ncbi:MAG: carboxylesterase family protein [Muribaculaceae bacterium]|nr:carboxylesterase family protein [Muribaculaceae bacterium]
MYFRYILIFLSAALMLSGCASGNSTATDALVKSTTYGLVRGYAHDSVAVFKGIPYAKAKRFGKPVSPSKWDTIMDCTRYGDIAPQTGSPSPTAYNPVDTVRTMSDNCLNLNIWTSMRDDSSDRPVMVWLHGGAFEYGSSHQYTVLDGTRLADVENVVVVTLNHRLGALGFLDLSAYGDEYDSSGNHGMLDIMTALWWIRDNIKAFGGDPTNITVFGEGAGGVKVLTLLAMPAAKGLFHKAIVQSGVLEGMCQEQELSRKVGVYTVEEAGVLTPDQLAEMPYEKIAAAAERAVERVNREYPRDRDNRVRLAPVYGTKVLPYPIYSDSAINAVADIPIIIGSNLTDLIYCDESIDCNIQCAEAVHNLTPAEFAARMKEKFGDRTVDVLDAFSQAYPDRHSSEVLVTDTRVRSLVLKIAHVLAGRSNAPVFVYLFSWTSPLNDGYGMSFRSAEIPFIFNNYEDAPFARAGGNEARRLSRIMSRCWATFARSGNPNNSITPFWRRINLGEGHTMVFDRDIHLETYKDLPLMRILHPDIVEGITLREEYSTLQ